MLIKPLRRLLEWNLFSSDNQDGITSDNHDERPTGPDPRRLQWQRVATRLYVLSMIICLFTLVMFTLLSWKKIVVKIHNPSIETFERLNRKYSTTLSCPCLTNAISYHEFIIIEARIHQICSSDFIHDKWINAFYVHNISSYSAIDFRKSANAQFNLLKTLCTLTRDNIFDALLELNHTQMSTSILVPEREVFLQANIRSEKIRRETTIRLNNALKLVVLSTQSSSIASALNTNLVFSAFRYPSTNRYVFSSSYTTWHLGFGNQTKVCICQYSSCYSPAGFYSSENMDIDDLRLRIRPQQYNASDVALGFFGACRPLDAIFQASFICLYDIKCIRTWTPYFPKLIHLIPSIKTLNASLQSRYQQNVTVMYLLEQLFLEQWNISIDYKLYFAKCAPKMCTYSYTRQFNFSYMITTLISVYGGLETILRFMILTVVKYIRSRRSIVSETDAMHEKPHLRVKKQIIQRVLNCFRIMKTKLIRLNLFKSTDRSPEAIYHQKLSTRIYLCLLLIFVFILLLLTTLSEQTNTVTYDHPSYTLYRELYTKYSDKLTCACSVIIPSYKSFITIIPIYHPICSSVFVTPIWLNQLKLKKPIPLSMTEWRMVSLSYFQSLSALCKLANNIVNNDVQAFYARTIVTTRLLNEDLLRSSINNTLEEFINSMQIEFEHVNNVLRLIFHVNQYFAGPSYNGLLNIYDESDRVTTTVKFDFSRAGNTFTERPCLCAIENECEDPMYIFHAHKRIHVPGFIRSCSPMDSILSSTLECLYSNNNCLNKILIHYINYSSPAVSVPPLNVSQLTRSYSNSTVLSLADHLFVEDWKILLSYKNYFNACAPSSCQHIFAERANRLYIITMFLSVYGGVILALNLLVPSLVKFALRCRRRHQQEPVNKLHAEVTVTANPIRAFCQHSYETVKIKIVTVNWFGAVSFGRNVDQITRERLSRITTRLYVGLYIVGLTVLIVYTAFEERTISINYYNPTMDTAEELQLIQSGTVECPCTRASIPLEELVTIQTRFHPICTSQFVSAEWREALILNYENISDASNINDYRHYVIGHLRFLSGLCYYSMKHVNDTINSFTSTFLITSRLLSRSLFDKQLSNLLYQTETHIPTSFIHALKLVRSINEGNALISVYGSNYEFVSQTNRYVREKLLYSLPVTFHGKTNCSCGLQSKCLRQAVFTSPHYTTVQGILIGCLPSESFLASTLECFFDADCINLIRHHMSGDINQSRVDPLDSRALSHSRYLINTTVIDVVNMLFMEKWSTQIFYDRYFNQCAPHICTYSYIDNINPLYIATTVLGLHSGLVLVMSWCCPRLVRVTKMIHTCYKKKHQVGFVSSIS